MTTNDPSAPGSTQRPVAVQLLQIFLGRRFRPLNATSWRRIRHLEVHHFEPVGDGYLLPVLYDGRPIHRPNRYTSGDPSSVSMLLLPEDRIDRSGLILGYSFFIGPELPESREAHCEYVLRLHIVLRKFGFRRPNLPAKLARKIWRDVYGGGGTR